MIQIGITGGIGAGKSTICKIFSSLGVPVLDADSLAKDLIIQDGQLKSDIIENFGSESYLEDGTYNRAYISKVVFNNAEALKKLNALVHPKVIENSIEWAKNHSDFKYIIKEAALMFESGSYKFNDYNIVVESPLNLRIDRICKRNAITEDEALRKIQSQLSDDERRSKADLIIINDEKKSLIEQIMNIHQNILSNNDPR